MSLLFSIRDNRPYPISQRRISPADDYCVDEPNDNDSQSNPRKEIKRHGLSWLYEGPERKTNCQNPEDRQDQVSQPGELIGMVSPVVHRQSNVRHEIGHRYQNRAKRGNLSEERNRFHSQAKDVHKCQSSAEKEHE